MVLAIPKSLRAGAWLRLAETKGRVDEFLRSQSDRHYRLELVVEALSGRERSRLPDFRYFIVHVASEADANRIAEELSLAIGKAGGDVAEFDVHSYPREYLA